MAVMEAVKLVSVFGTPSHNRRITECQIELGRYFAHFHPNCSQPILLLGWQWSSNVLEAMVPGPSAQKCVILCRSDARLAPSASPSAAPPLEISNILSAGQIRRAVWNQRRHWQQQTSANSPTAAKVLCIHGRSCPPTSRNFLGDSLKPDSYH